MTVKFGDVAQLPRSTESTNAARLHTTA